MKYYLAVAGNIGAGKTTLAERLAQRLDWELFNEPFEGNPYLEKFYADMKAWSFHCEISFLSERLTHQLEILKRPHSVIQDRCLYEGAEIFVRNLYNQEHLSEVDWQTYQRFYQNIISFLTPPDLIIYLKSSPERCLANTKKRGRAIDGSIDPAYMRSLHWLYENWASNFKISPILTLEMDKKNYLSDEKEFAELLDEIDLQLARKT